MSADPVDQILTAHSLSHRHGLAGWAPPVLLCGAMLAVAVVVSVLASIDATALFYPYFYVSSGMTFLAMLTFIFVEIGRMALRRADRPLQAVAGRICHRASLLLFPLVLFPLFLIGFTTAKTGIPFIVGYAWERVWADVDAAIFGTDVWRLAVAIAPSWSLKFWEFSYTLGWGAITYFAVAFITLSSEPRKVMTFFTATFATWLFGGWLCAYAFSAAGPVFAHLTDPSLQARFVPLHEFLNANLSASGPILFTQQYLEAVLLNHVAVKGGGISAMPSMHLGMAALLVIAAWPSVWRLPAICFWTVIFIGSGLFGYHYWVDGIIGAAIAGLSWWLARACYEAIDNQMSSRKAAASEA